MDSVELLLAAEVRRLALELRSGEWAVHARQPAVLKRIRVTADNLSGDADERKSWNDERPLANYIPQAFKLIHETALHIQAIKAQA